MFRSARLAMPVTLVLTCALMFMSATTFTRRAAASANTPRAGWELTASSYPTNLPPGGTGFIMIHVFNVGAASSNGTVTVTDVLPPGLTAVKAGEVSSMGQENTQLIKQIGSRSLWDCSGSRIVRCVNDPQNMPFLTGGGGGPAGEGPSFAPEIAIAVEVESGASETATNRVSMAGGGALNTANTTSPITVSSKSPSFDFPGWDAWFSNADGTLDTQAGSHPYEATFTFDLANIHCGSAEEKISGSACREGEEIGHLHSAGSARNIAVDVPPGLIGDPNAVPQCTRRQLDTEKCPDASQIGIATATVEGGLINRWRVYNIVPPAGAPAEFGFSLLGYVTLLDASVRSSQHAAGESRKLCAGPVGRAGRPEPCPMAQRGNRWLR
jgi:uncharacterized repeat protein (TIGR01451 family)